ncbi:peptide chain release factor N(5)-glutamine methyltransferase [Alteromonas aestuariivivens]|uniref:Release factor glutamine methyltransferase n=1 Tax=Alteromonas aestuariivivens TaxID=1938339 RepID=A0A3D8MD15_9ALTE|nr:peptide chain release factor N(5)-glutamine methyltransferase [Alteromonas aestuariivivens]RDV27573.1 peptide chain release factor N(5)-glutamine methyltransferase [Alteromonas aestuariivivens]
MRIDQALAWACDQLSGGESPQVDARIMLASVLEQSQTYLFTWPDKILSAAQLECFQKNVERRLAGEPVAYITGTQGFWSLNLKVSTATLIPRPETELLVELALALNLPTGADICDLGTGTGAIALAIASERPDCNLIGVDVVEEAVQLAMLNARLNGISNARFLHSHWFSALEGLKFDLLVSNPPYVESGSEYLSQGDVRFEPASALTSGKDGMDDIRHIVSQAVAFLKPRGWLLIEHGYAQGAAIRAELAQGGFEKIETRQDLNGLDRVTLGCLKSCV